MEYKGYTGTLHQQKDGGYYGRVLDTSGNLRYSGMTMDSVESAFRATVDDYIRKKRRVRLSILGGLACLLAILAVMVVTCPDEAAHKAAVGDVVKQGLGISAGDEDNGLAAFAMLIGGGITDYALQHMLSYENKFVYSVGTITYEGETKPLSIGIFGHVFTTVSKEDVAKMIDEL